MKSFTFADISEMPDDKDLPRLDRRHEAALNPYEYSWQKDGVVILSKFIPEDLIQKYGAIREKLNDPAGWPAGTPYMKIPEIKDIGLYPPLMQIMKDLIGDDMGMHLNLTGWVSTQRNWHQDDYLNPPHVNSWYTAVWMALDDIHPDSGPFQYVPGSHKWPLVRRDKLFKHIPEAWRSDPNWPTLTQDPVSRCFEEEAAKQGVEIVTYLPKKGDVLIWHGRLMHRGSEPNIPGMLRKSLICHYSALSKRIDMPKRTQHNNGSWYFVL